MRLVNLSSQLCYDIRNVPDAVNESKQIFKMISVLVMVAAAIFAVTLGVKIDHFIEVGWPVHGCGCAAHFSLFCVHSLDSFACEGTKGVGFLVFFPSK